MNPTDLRRQIKKAEGTQRRRLIQALWLRDITLLAFAIAYIATFARLFGNANSVVGVASFCMLLAIRFIDYGYHVGDSGAAMLIILGLMGINGVLAFVLPAFWVFWLHALSVLLIVRLTAQHPEFGNGGVYTFGYILVTGSPVLGRLLWLRFAALALAFLVCFVVLWRNHRGQNQDVRVWHVLTPLDLHEAVDRWQLRLALGVGAALATGSALGISRPMWIGFAAMSLLLPVKRQLAKRAVTRLTGVAIGSALFAVFVMVLPHNAIIILAPLAGLGLGLTGDYLAASVFNCFGALSIAYTIYGSLAASGLRVLDNGLGLAVALGLAWGLEWLWNHHHCHQCVE